MEWLKNEMKFVSSIDEIGKYSNVFAEHFSVRQRIIVTGYEKTHLLHTSTYKYLEIPILII